MASAALGPLIVDLDGDPSLTNQDRERLQCPQVGGVILFSRNYENRLQLRSLTREIKEIRSPELLIAVDQEGGRVQRFRGRFTRLPPVGACGVLYDSKHSEGKQLAYNMGLVMARELIDCGVDLSFAPVLDVLQCNSHVIGDRAFHSDPDAVHFLASSYISGMGDAGMGSVGKHFPGHGSVSADSHTSLPEDKRLMAALRGCDLLPYTLLNNQLRGVMLAHVLYKSIDVRIPSYSSFWIHDVLKEDIGFRGVVFSDDLSMTGAGNGSTLERCRAARNAGCDLLPVCNDLDAVDKLLGERREEWIGNGADAAVASLYARPKPVDPRMLETAREIVEMAAYEFG
ncbi:MAG: Beta-hexosaminidase [Gammaproteobacteria bacterium]|nr:Beta-hexosaminidase [Gammaproteobacteria bacterium]